MTRKNHTKQPAPRDDSKQQKIVTMFDDIAPTYDLTNRVMSFGIDKQWRKKGCDKALEILNTRSISRVADIACGTGDLLLYWKERATKRGVTIRSFVGIDPSVKMLEIARKKVEFAEFIEAQAQSLPLADASCEIVSISYGIRNVTDRKRAFSEFNRVLKPGGMVVILEFTKRKRSNILSLATDLYVKKIIPTLGGLISKNRDAYRYLPKSIEHFLTTEMLENELKQAGFAIRYSKSFSFGVSTLLIAQKR